MWYSAALICKDCTPAIEVNHFQDIVKTQTHSFSLCNAVFFKLHAENLKTHCSDTILNFAFFWNSGISVFPHVCNSSFLLTLLQVQSCVTQCFPLQETNSIADILTAHAQSRSCINMCRLASLLSVFLL